MAHLKKANAMVVHPRISGRGWNSVKRASKETPARNINEQAREILGCSPDPDKFLFTHCTIMASVDVDRVQGTKIGKIKEGSKTINRKYSDFYIKPNCSQFVNNNGDSWSRPVLAKSFHTFIGGHNFQEHVQIEAQSKGRILDAVSRDLGDSLYIDLLIATNLKHTQLINDIKSGEMGTLSMGCTTEFTICSKCGHVSADETEACDCIKYEKLNTFLDDDGNKRVVAELCGHQDFDETGGVKFIEASWVRVPAFTGAVMRNIMKVGGINISEADVKRMLVSSAPSWSETAVMKVASSRNLLGFGEDEPSEDAPEEAPEEKNPLKDVEDSLYQSLTDRVKQRVLNELEKGSESKKPVTPSDAPNDSVIKEASQKLAQNRYAKLTEAIVRSASSDAALVNSFAVLNETFGMKVAVDVYRTALSIGKLSDLHKSPESLRKKCASISGRVLTSAELRVVVRIGSLLSRLESIQQPASNHNN